MRDRFVVGLSDSKLSDKLCRNSKLSLDEALLQVRQNEDAEKERIAREAKIGAPSAPVCVDAAKIRSGNRNRPPRAASAAKASAATKGGSAAPTSGGSCHFCGRPAHPRTDCPARRASCNKCHKKGHFATVCRSSVASVELYEIGSLSQPKAKFVDVEVNGTPVRFKVDSGAEVSVIPSTFSGIPSRLDPPEGELMGPGGQPLVV